MDNGQQGNQKNEQGLLEIRIAKPNPLGGGRFESLMEEIEDPVFVGPTATIIEWEGSIYERLADLRCVSRLLHIKQLGLAKACLDMAGANNNRYQHSLIFATKIDYLAQRFGLDRNLAVTAAMAHDIASTPYSDSVSKFLGLDDQESFLSVVESNPDLLRFLHEYGIDIKRLARIVKGKDNSVIGQLVSSKDSIDIDRWSYTIFDALFTAGVASKLISTYEPDPFEFMEIVDGMVVFSDGGPVKAFIEARTQMFERVYRHKQSIAKDVFIGVLVKEMIEHGVFKKTDLFKMVDDELESACIKYNTKMANQLFHYDGFTTYDGFDVDPEELEEFLFRKIKGPFIVRKGFSFNPALGTPVSHGNSVKRFEELEPTYAEYVRERIKTMKLTSVYGLEEDTDLQKAVSRAREHFKGK